MSGPAGGFQNVDSPVTGDIAPYVTVSSGNSYAEVTPSAPSALARTALSSVEGPRLVAGGPGLAQIGLHNSVQCAPSSGPPTTLNAISYALAFRDTGRQTSIPTDGSPVSVNNVPGSMLGLSAVTTANLTFRLESTTETTGNTFAHVVTVLTITGTLYGEGNTELYSGGLAELVLGDVAVNCAAAPMADVSIDKLAPATVAANGTITYTLTAKNNGPDAADNVVVEDELDNRLDFISVTPSTCRFADNTVTCDLGTMAPDSEREITITARPAAGTAAGAEIENCGTVTTDTRETNDADNQSCTTTIVTPAPTNVSITKTGTTSTTPGGSVSYTLTATNTSGTAAHGVVVTDVIPRNLTLTRPPAGCTYARTSRTLTCAIGTLRAHRSRTITLTGTLSMSARPGSAIQNCAAITTTTPETNETDNRDCAPTDVEPSPTNVAITKTGTTRTTPGGTVRYTLTARNTSGTAAHGVVVTDVIPAELTLTATPVGCTVRGSRTLTCAIGTLGAHRTRTITLTGTLSMSARPGSAFQNCAAITTTTPETNETDNRYCAPTAVGPAPPSPATDIEMAKSGPVTIAPGLTASYTLTVTNRGSVDAHGVVVTDDIPDDFTLTVVPAGCTLTGRTLTCDIGTLPAGGTRTITLTGTLSSSAMPGDDLENCAEATSMTPDSNPMNNEACTGALIVEYPADLVIAKTGPATAGRGGTVTYTVTVTNNGPDHAVGTVMSDILPAGLTVTSVPAGCTLTGRTLSCDIGTLPAGGTRTFSITGTVSGTATPGSVIGNCATVTSTIPDPDLSNNSACTMTTVEVPVPPTDIALAKTGPATAVPGGTVTYTLTITNRGSADATDTIVGDVFSDELTISSVPAECALAGRTLTCAVGTLPGGATRTFSVTARLSPDAILGTMAENCGTAYTSSPETNLADNASCVRALVSMPSVPVTG